jgi:hypothetical protein
VCNDSNELDSLHETFSSSSDTLSDTLSEKWSKYDSIESLSNHQSISDTLWNFLDQCQPVCSFKFMIQPDIDLLMLQCHSGDCRSRARVQMILRLDATFIIAQLCSIRNNPDHKRALFSQHNSTKSLLNLLQAVGLMNRSHPCLLNHASAP